MPAGLMVDAGEASKEEADILPHSPAPRVLYFCSRFRALTIGSGEVHVFHMTWTVIVGVAASPVVTVLGKKLGYGLLTM